MKTDDAPPTADQRMRALGGFVRHPAILRLQHERLGERVLALLNDDMFLLLTRETPRRIARPREGGERTIGPPGIRAGEEPGPRIISIGGDMEGARGGRRCRLSQDNREEGKKREFHGEKSPIVPARFEECR